MAKTGSTTHAEVCDGPPVSWLAVGLTWVTRYFMTVSWLSQHVLHPGEIAYRPAGTPVKASLTQKAATDDDDHRRPTLEVEGLPAELRVKILHLLDLDSLKALVFASPLYHRQYRLQRKELLLSSIDNTLGRYAADAIGELHYAASGPTETDGHANCTCFYRRRLERADYSIQAEKLLSTEVEHMARFYYNTVRPLVPLYAKYALQNLERYLGSTWPHSQSQRLSDSESLRIKRALYRYQIICNTFGTRETVIDNIGAVQSSMPHSNHPNHQFDGISMFLDRVFGPWEIEEIACVFRFVQSQYSRLFQQVCWDVNQYNPKFCSIKDFNYTVDLSCANPSRWNLVTSAASYGLIPLARLLRKDVTQKVKAHEIMAKTTRIVDFLESALGTAAQARRIRSRQRQALRRELKWLMRVPMYFTGEDLTDREHPPWAWARLWESTCGNLYGAFLPPPLCEWGYVMWDEKRMLSSNGIWLVKSQAKKCWRSGIPSLIADYHLRMRFRRRQLPLHASDSENEHLHAGPVDNIELSNRSHEPANTNARPNVQDGEESSLHDYEPGEMRPRQWRRSAASSSNSERSRSRGRGSDSSSDSDDDDKSFHDVAIGDDSEEDAKATQEKVKESVEGVKVPDHNSPHSSRASSRSSSKSSSRSRGSAPSRRRGSNRTKWRMLSKAKQTAEKASDDSSPNGDTPTRDSRGFIKGARKSRRKSYSSSDSVEIIDV